MEPGPQAGCRGLPPDCASIHNGFPMLGCSGGCAQGNGWESMAHCMRLSLQLTSRRRSGLQCLYYGKMVHNIDVATCIGVDASSLSF
eukprot:2476706-Amphidinium_carterae.1